MFWAVFFLCFIFVHGWLHSRGGNEAPLHASPFYTTTIRGVIGVMGIIVGAWYVAR